MLVEMDGLKKMTVNPYAPLPTADVLDPALLRRDDSTVRFLCRIRMSSGREQILDVHLKRCLLGWDVDSRKIALGTYDSSGLIWPI